MKLALRLVLLLLGASGQISFGKSEILDTLFSPAAEFGDLKLVIHDPKTIDLFASHRGMLEVKRFLTRDQFVGLNPAIPANWLATVYVAKENVILALVASAEDQRMRLYRIDAARKAELLAVLAEKDEALRIDPTLLVVDGQYFATVTEIVGEINNGDPKIKMGQYTVRLFTSHDLSRWTAQSVVASEQRNLEDGSLVYDPKTKSLYFVYEDELLDKGSSAIRFRRSTDMGQTWGSAVTLIDDHADTEPATASVVGDELRLFYSTDRDHPHMSYDGGDLYLARFSLPDGRPLGENRLTDAGTGLVVLSGFPDSVGGGYVVAAERNYLSKPAIMEARLDAVTSSSPTAKSQPSPIKH